jgi:hypothetical protein
MFTTGRMCSRAAEIARLPVELQGKIVPFRFELCLPYLGRHWRAIAGPVIEYVRRAAFVRPVAL